MLEETSQQDEIKQLSYIKEKIELKKLEQQQTKKS